MSVIPSSIRVSIIAESHLHAYQGWRIEVSDDDDPLFSFEPPPPVRIYGQGLLTTEVPKVVHDAFAVRAALFRVDDVEAAAALLATYGPLKIDKLYGVRASPVRLSEIRFLRDRRKAFLLRETTAGDFRVQGYEEPDLTTFAAVFDIESSCPPEVRLVRRAETVVGLIDAKDISSATHAAVYLDRLTGFGWSECEECQLPFKRESRRRQRFCTPACQSYASTQKHLHPDLTLEERRESWRRKPDPM